MIFILSMPNNKYKFQDGTSMASPVVAGIASLIMSYFPRLSAKKVKEIILESGIDIILMEILERKYF